MWQPWSDLKQLNRSIVLLEKEFSLFLRDKKTISELRASSHLAQVWKACDRDPQQVALMARIKTGHAMTPRHGINVMLICRAWMTMSHRLGKKLDSFSFAALIHDAGHWRPDDLVNVFDPFTHSQAKRLHLHVKDLDWAGDSLEDDAKTWISQHHEQPDGKGYPAGLEKPEPLSQVLRIVDCFEGLTTFRRFRMLYSHPDAMTLMMRWAGYKYDAGLFKSYVNFMGSFPAGTFVTISSGAMAITLPPVKGTNACLVLTSSEGDPLSEDGIFVEESPQILKEAVDFHKQTLPDAWRGLRPDLMNLRRVYPTEQ